MKDNGFTLIELLAVIVILAIIALIATPIVLNIIEDSKDSSRLNSANHYLDAVEQAIMKKNMDGDNFVPCSCEVQKDGILLCDNKTIKVEIDGKTPTSGTIVLENGVMSEVKLSFDNKIISKNSRGELVYYTPVCSLVEDVDSNKTITVGDKYRCKVKNVMETGYEDGYSFYVLSLNANGTINLILDRNIYYDSKNDVGLLATKTNPGVVAWYQDARDNSFGPVTAMNYLYNATKDWDNLQDIVIDYTDEGNKGKYGYGKIVTERTEIGTITSITNKTGDVVTASYKSLKTRLPYYNEVTANEIGNWIYERNNSVTSGYYTFTSTNYASNKTLLVSYMINSMGHDFVDISNNFGVRPVITLSKIDLK